MLKPSHTDTRSSKIGDIQFKQLAASLYPQSSSTERRDLAARRSLLRRVWLEFDEMPGTSLTLPQATRLFGIPAEVCGRILGSLVNDGRLRQTQDGRFRLRSFAA
jgi:hypothetical protein